MTHEVIELHDRLSTMESEIQKLRESEARYRTLFEAAHVGINTIEAGRYVDCNPASLRLFGCRRDDLIGKSPDSFSTEIQTDRRSFEDSSANRIELALEGEPQLFECRYTRRDGTHFDAEVSLNHFELSGKRFVLEIIRDISRRKQAENNLKDTVTQLHTLIGAIPDVIYFKDTQGRNPIFNQAFQDLTGMNHPDIVGKTDEELFPEKMAMICQNSDNEVLESGKTIRFEDVYTLSDGREIIFDTIKSPLFDETGKIEGVVGISRDVTERKRAEEVIRESELKYRTLFEDSRDAIYQRDRNGILLNTNQAMEELFGYTRDEFIGMNVRDLRVVPSDMDRFQEELETKGFVRTYEERLIKKDGTEMMCQISSTAGAGEGRASPFYHGIIRDVTERRRIEARLIQSEEKFRLLFEKSADAILLLDDGEIMDCNQTALEMMGCRQKSQLLGRHPSHFSAERQSDGRLSSEIADEIITTALEQGNLRFEWVFRRIDGSEFPAEVALIPIPLDGRPIVYNTFRDISRRRRAEEKSKRSERQLAEIINFLPDATWAIDSEGKVTVWNRGAETMTGIQAQDILGKGNYEYALPVYGMRRPLLIDLVLNPDHEIESNYDFIKREGNALIGEAGVCLRGITKRNLWGKASAIYNSNGEIVGAIESVRDITDQKNAEQEKKRLESQLLHAQKMEALGVLAGGIAHDFNNILTGLLGYAELSLYNIPDEGEARYSINQILKAGSRAKDLVKQILAFSRQMEQEKIPVKVAPIVKETLKLLRASLPRTITIRQEITPKDDTILADPSQIHQILMNLCTNAHHAMPEKGGVLGITLHSVELDEKEASSYQGLSPGHFLKLTVSDTGHGMDDHIIKKIFDPYFTTKPQGIGTGLGLSVVHGIVRDHGGEILVSSKKRKGTSFTIFLPSVEMNQEENLEAFQPIRRGTERILLVDDEKAITDLGVRIIGHLGYRVTAMTSSIAAIKTFMANPDQYDLVITDMTMPGMTGDVLAGKILKIRPDIPIILCTGFSESISEVQSKRTGIRALIMKPFSMREFGKVIRRVLDDRHSTPKQQEQ